MRHLLSATIALSLLTIPVLAQSPPSTPAATNEDSPRRLTINVTVAEPNDLKVEQGDRLQVGTLIADRGRERRRLDNQKAQLSLSLERLQTATITAPLPPAAAPPILEPSYLEEDAAIARAQATVEQAEAAIASKEQELTYLSDIDDLDPLILEHETAKLDDLHRAHTAAVRDHELAIGKRSTTAYRHSITVAEAVAHQNRAALEYQQQWARYEERLRDRQFQISQAQLRLNEVENAIASLAVVRAPYGGTVRRVKWLGQSADGLLSAEVTVLVDGGDRPSQPRL